jgi:hypothetical protein
VRARIFRLQTRNPIVAVALLIVVLALIAAVVAVGFTLLAGAAVLGAAGLLVRRALGGGRATLPEPRSERALDRAQEVFPPTQRPPERRLPPAPDGDQTRG